MAIRTTAAAVKLILLGNYDAINLPSVDPFIEAASSVVDDVVTNAAADGISIGTTKAELMERWLSAHCYTLADRMYKSRSELGASGSFDGQTGMGLDFTQYGQMARTFDQSGWLDSLASGEIATVTWLGKTARDQLNYSDRND